MHTKNVRKQLQKIQSSTNEQALTHTHTHREGSITSSVRSVRYQRDESKMERMLMETT